MNWAGVGTVLSDTVFNMYEDGTLGCGDACGGVRERFGCPFDVSLWMAAVLIEGGT